MYIVLPYIQVLISVHFRLTSPHPPPTHTHTPHLQRFLVPKHVSPAPTTYQDPRTAFENVQKMTGMKRSPFGQTSARFRTDRQAKELPGTYQALVGGVLHSPYQALVGGVPHSPYQALVGGVPHSPYQALVGGVPHSRI